MPSEQDRARQPFIPGMAKDKAKSVSVPSRPSHAPQMAGRGISVGRDWKIIADEMNVIVYKRAKTKSGGERWETFGYFFTLGNALVGLVRQGIRDTQLENIKAVQDQIARLEHDILKMAAGR
jgi:hypothetical protein